MNILKLISLVLFTCFNSASYAGPNEDLLAACKAGNFANAKAAIDAGADVNFLTDGNTPLSTAAYWPDITRLLLDKGANPNLGNAKPLFQATTLYSTEVIKMLLDAGADPNKPSLTDPTTLFKGLIATEKAKGKDANEALIKAWIGAMATAKPTEVYALSTAVYGTSCTACVEMLLTKGAKLDNGITDGTLLHLYGSSVGKSKEVWKQGFAQGKGSIEGFGLKVPDWYAAEMSPERFGSAEEMLKLLLAKGLNINEKNKAGSTPLELALNGGFGGYSNVMLALIKNGADVKIESAVYGPLIFQAAQTGSVEVIKAMVEKGVDLNTDGKFFAQSDALLTGYTPLTIAALKNHLELVKYLISAGVKTDKGVEGKFLHDKTKCLTKVSDKTAIYFAIENGNLEMVKFMAESQSNWSKRIKLHEMKKNELGVNVFGQKVEVISCYGAGEYIPSRYARAIKLPEIEDYLKTKGL